MERLLRDMPLFVEVAKQKSFTLTSEALDMPVSTLSAALPLLNGSWGCRC